MALRVLDTGDRGVIHQYLMAVLRGTLSRFRVAVVGRSGGLQLRVKGLQPNAAAVCGGLEILTARTLLDCISSDFVLSLLQWIHISLW